MSVAVCPEFIVAEFTFTIGNGFTVTVATAVLEQPLFVIVTVYVVVVTGETEIELVVAPLDHIYVFRVAGGGIGGGGVIPDGGGIAGGGVIGGGGIIIVPIVAIRVAVCPEQIVVEFTVTVGGGFSVTVAIVVLEQPFLVTITV